MDINSEIFCVVVIFNIDENKSNSLITLNNSLEKINQKFNILIYNNSTHNTFNIENTKNKYTNFNIQYFEDKTNPGISKPYNLALKKAEESNFRYLLLLDQDTIFNIDYVKEIVSLDLNDNNVNGYLPKVFTEKKQLISPIIFSFGGITFNYSRGKIGFISAINSGSLLNVNFLKKINGFDNSFPLDMLDHITFKKLSKIDGNINVLNSSIIQDLSIKNYKKNINIIRYKSILKSENNYFKNDDFINRLVYKLRLFVRIFKMCLLGQKSLINVSLIYLFK